MTSDEFQPENTEPNPATQPTTELRGAWRFRYWLARTLIEAGRSVMPECRYKRELNAALWTLALKVQATVAADRAKKSGVQYD